MKIESTNWDIMVNDDSKIGYLSQKSQTMFFDTRTLEELRGLLNDFFLIKKEKAGVDNSQTP